jgi:hypothetical protein
LLALSTLAVLVVAGCTSARDGDGATSASGSASASGGSGRPSSGSPAPPTSESPTTVRPAPTGSAARTRASTAIGDPVTADLCAAIGLDALGGIGTGLTPTFDNRQDPPGCSVTLSAGEKPVVGLSVFADAGVPRAATGRTTRTEAGETVYVYPFETSTGRCEREIDARRVLLVVDSYQPGAAKVDRATACAGTDAMTARLADVVNSDNVPRLELARPTVSDLNACAVVRRAGITSLSDFAKGALRSLSFGVGCQIRPANVFLFVNFMLSSTRRPPGSTSTTVGTHTVYAVSTTGGFCSYFSAQGQTSDRRYEQIALAATATDPNAAPAALCEQTKVALGRYLDAAGLR